MILRAARAALDGRRGGAHPAGFQIGEPQAQLLLEALVEADRLARRSELALEDLPQPGHGRGPEVGTPPALEQFAHVVEREAQVVEQVDPAQPVHRRGLEQPETPARARGGLKQAHRLVEVKRPDRLARQAGHVPDAEQMRSLTLVVNHLITLTLALDSAWNLHDSMRLVNILRP